MRTIQIYIKFALSGAITNVPVVDILSAFGSTVHFREVHVDYDMKITAYKVKSQYIRKSLTEISKASLILTHSIDKLKGTSKVWREFVTLLT